MTKEFTPIPVGRTVEDLNLQQLMDGENGALFLSGRAEGQVVHGGTATGKDLTLHSNQDKDGKIFLGANSAYDQLNDRLSIGATSSNATFNVDSLEGAAEKIVGQFRNNSGGLQVRLVEGAPTQQVWGLRCAGTELKIRDFTGAAEPIRVAAGAPNAALHIETGVGRIRIGPNSPRFTGRTSSTADPSTAELPANKDFGLHKNTSSGAVFLAYNDGGTIKKVALT